MEQIEVNIKLASNNHIYNLPIRKSETILKLKEYCQIISDIPQIQQNLLYKGKILSNEKNIDDYNIKNNDDIILVKKEEPKPVNVLLENNSGSSNSNSNLINKIKSLSDNKEININEVAKALGQIPDILSYFNKIDIDKLNNFCQSMGLENLYRIEPQKYKELLKIIKDPSNKDIMNNMFKDPSILKTIFNSPELKIKNQNDPIFKLFYQNPQIFLSPQILQKNLNLLEKDKKNKIESSKTEISVPPDPFGNINNNYINQMKNSSGEISYINTFNNNSTENKEIFGNCDNDIDYKEKYKEQLSLLKDMGFINEESNIQALKRSNGNINNALEKLLK